METIMMYGLFCAEVFFSFIWLELLLLTAEHHQTSTKPSGETPSRCPTTGMVALLLSLFFLN